MTIKEAIKILKNMKSYYNDRKHEIYEGFELDDNEAIDKAIKVLEQQEVKGYLHQNLDCDLFKEIMTNADKMCAFVQLQRGICDFIKVMEDIDINVDVQTKKGR